MTPAVQMLTSLAGQTPQSIEPPPREAAPLRALPTPAKPTQQGTPGVEEAYATHRQNLEGSAALASLVSSQPPPVPQKEETEPGGTVAGRVAADVGRGILESPLAVVKGARDAIQSTMDGVADLGAWAENHIRDNGHDYTQEWRGLELPDVKEPTTVTGSIVKNTAEFISAMRNVGKVFGEMPSTVKGGIAMFSGFEGAGGRLSDLVQKVPALQNPVTDFLSSKPDDNEAEARLKNTAEGLGLGTLTGGLVKALRVLKAGNSAQEVGQAGIEELAKQGAEEPSKPVSTPAAFKFLGDPDAPPEAPLAEIRSSTEDMTRMKAGMAARAT